MVDDESWEPCPLYRLGEYLRDRTWVDLRVPDVGFLQRVLIIEIIVRRGGDEVLVRQEWVDDAGRHKTELKLDAESIWRAEPTSCDLMEVSPPQAVREQGVNEQVEKIIDAVIEAVGYVFPYVKRDALLAYTCDYREVHHRHQAIVALYEMTELSPHYICTKVFSYRSQQPYLTAWGKCTYPGDDGKDMRADVQLIAEAAEARLGSKPRRKQFPPSYTPVLV